MTDFLSILLNIIGPYTVTGIVLVLIIFIGNKIYKYKRIFKYYSCFWTIIISFLALYVPLSLILDHIIYPNISEYYLKNIRSDCNYYSRPDYSCKELADNFEKLNIIFYQQSDYVVGKWRSRNTKKYWTVMLEDCKRDVEKLGSDYKTLSKERVFSNACNNIKDGWMIFDFPRKESQCGLYTALNEQYKLLQKNNCDVGNIHLPMTAYHLESHLQNKLSGSRKTTRFKDTMSRFKFILNHLFSS